MSAQLSMLELLVVCPRGNGNSNGNGNGNGNTQMTSRDLQLQAQKRKELLAANKQKARMLLLGISSITSRAPSKRDNWSSTTPVKVL